MSKHRPGLTGQHYNCCTGFWIGQLLDFSGKNSAMLHEVHIKPDCLTPTPFTQEVMWNHVPGEPADTAGFGHQKQPAVNDHVQRVAREDCPLLRFTKFILTTTNFEAECW